MSVCRISIWCRDRAPGWLYREGGLPVEGYNAVELPDGNLLFGQSLRRSAAELTNIEISDNPELYEYLTRAISFNSRGAEVVDIIELGGHTSFTTIEDKQYGFYASRLRVRMRLSAAVGGEAEDARIVAFDMYARARVPSDIDASLANVSGDFMREFLSGSAGPHAVDEELLEAQTTAFREALEALFDVGL